jgi:hypothetical protein
MPGGWNKLISDHYSAARSQLALFAGLCNRHLSDSGSQMNGMAQAKIKGKLYSPRLSFWSKIIPSASAELSGGIK